MKALNNILRNSLPVLATAGIFALSLSSCGSEISHQQDEPSTPVVRPVVFEAPAVEKPADKYFDLEDLKAEPTEAASIEEQMSVLKAVACLGIENHEPVDTNDQFDIVAPQKIWIYSKVKMPKGETGKIQHVYIHNDKEVQTVELDVKGPTFRTRSYKTIRENMCGDWKVEIRTESGILLDTVNFFADEMGGC